MGGVGEPARPSPEALHWGMANRAMDWLTQGRPDLEFARHAALGGFHEWACCAAQQAAE